MYDKNTKTMNIWDKLSKINIKNKEKYTKIFSEIIKKIKNNEYKLEERIEEKEDYFIVNEENRKNSFFVHIVPKEAYYLFKEMKEKAPNEFLGFSVLAGKKEDKDIRVSCFGIPCSLLGKGLIKFISYPK